MPSTAAERTRASTQDGRVSGRQRGRKKRAGGGEVLRGTSPQPDRHPSLQDNQIGVAPHRLERKRAVWILDDTAFAQVAHLAVAERSEERRVGKECRSRWSPYH